MRVVAAGTDRIFQIIMPATQLPAGEAWDRRRELQAFDDTKAGVKGLVDAGVTALPPIFRHSPESLEGITSSNHVTGAIPTVDLSAARREDTVALVRRAAGTVGFFQVVNHGVPAELMAGMLEGVRRFNEGPAEAKQAIYSRDQARKVRFASNFDLFSSAAANWRDTLFFHLAPDPAPSQELPEAVRDVVTEYGKAVTKVALSVLELLSESLGLSSDHLRDMGCAENLNAVCQYYPPCPEPYLTWGTKRHTDPGFLTVLLQDGMGGLQLVSNDQFRSVEHRVLANKSKDTARVSVASFFNTDMERSTRLYGPITDGRNPPIYRSVTARDFIATFNRIGLDGRSLDHYRLDQHTPTPAVEGCE
ncbi:hypothetical protein VPH35_034161 [Triticum aestivum]